MYFWRKIYKNRSIRFKIRVDFYFFEEKTFLVERAKEMGQLNSISLYNSSYTIIIRTQPACHIDGGFINLTTRMCIIDIIQYLYLSL